MELVMADVKRLLIVDDEETLTFSLYQTFINAPIDCEVVTASSAEEAMEKLKNNKFNIIITDIAMPGMNGLELLARVKAMYPDTHVIVITAYGSDEREEKAYQLGATKYIEKPFELKDLKSEVLNLLGI